MCGSVHELSLVVGLFFIRPMTGTSGRKAILKRLYLALIESLVIIAYLRSSGGRVIGYPLVDPIRGLF